MSKSIFIAKTRGSALIIALVFLLILTLVGVTAMQGTSQQEIMAGNMRDRSLAFQAAEAALRYCIRTQLEPPAVLPSVATATLPDGWVRRAEGDVDDNGGGADFWRGEFTNRLSLYANRSTNSVTTTRPNSTQLSGVVEEPSCIIEDTRSTDMACSSSSLNCYRITARGFGGTQNAVAIVQQTFYRR